MTPLARLAPCALILLLAHPTLARGDGTGEGDRDDQQVELQNGVEGSPPPEGEPPPAPPQGSLFRPAGPTRWRAAANFGSGTSYGHNYAIFGGLLGYQVGGGFEVYLDGQYWGGARPTLGRLAPGVNWYAPIPYRPYVGVYYARWFVGGGEPDLDALGGRVGLAIASTPRAVLGAGMAYERVLACRGACEAWWPELSVGIKF